MARGVRSVADLSARLTRPQRRALEGIDIMRSGNGPDWDLEEEG